MLEQDTFGHAGHRNQDVVECTGEVFSGTVADFFPPAAELPDGVALTDEITGSLEVSVIIKQ